MGYKYSSGASFWYPGPSSFRFELGRPQLMRELLQIHEVPDDAGEEEEADDAVASGHLGAPAS